MKPIKALLPVSIWLMRIGLLLFAYSEYFKTFTKFHLDDLGFYIAALFMISAAIIFITGFICRITLTVISGVVISLISICSSFIIDLFIGVDSLKELELLIGHLTFFSGFSLGCEPMAGTAPAVESQATIDHTLPPFNK